MTEYIKREDVMERVGRWQLNTREAIAEMIMSVPSADVVERKHGKWIDPADLICYKCTACGMYANQGYGLDEPIFWDYCPNCGADMRGGEMSVLIKGITLEQFYRDLNNVRDMDVDWDIVQLPADVVERKRGEWYDRGSLSCRCSNCGCKANKEYSFCPNCGADMRGPKDD